MDRNKHSRNGQNIKRRVALRKESVDRNMLSLSSLPVAGSSLSARRAWIEMIDYIVDYVNDASRSPQGERG